MITIIPNILYVFFILSSLNKYHFLLTVFNETRSSHRRKAMKKFITSLLCTTICGTVLTTGSVNAQANSSTNSNSLKELQDEDIVPKSITEEQRRVSYPI